MSESLLYFAYTSMLSPDRIFAVAPGASFQFSAHYPETQLAFIADDDDAIPTMRNDPGHTVWGGVFAVSSEEIEAITAAELAGGRIPGWEAKAIDRNGNKHECLTFVAQSSSRTERLPSPDYIKAIIDGARHWDLPAGWIVGLEDLVEDPLFR